MVENIHIDMKKKTTWRTKLVVSTADNYKTPCKRANLAKMQELKVFFYGNSR